MWHLGMALWRDRRPRLTVYARTRNSGRDVSSWTQSAVDGRSGRLLRRMLALRLDGWNGKRAGYSAGRAPNGGGSIRPFHPLIRQIAVSKLLETSQPHHAKRYRLAMPCRRMILSKLA